MTRRIPLTTQYQRSNFLAWIAICVFLPLSLVFITATMGIWFTLGVITGFVILQGLIWLARKWVARGYDDGR